MFLFFFGSDTYRSRAKLSAVVSKFIEKNPDAKAEHYIGVQLVSGQLADLLAPSLFSIKRLVVLEDFLATAPEAVQAELVPLLSDLPNDIVLVIRETEKFDIKTEIAKTLMQPGCFQQFDILTKPQTIVWVSQQAAECGLTLPPALATQLATACDFDPWRITNEIKKLAALGTPVTSSVIEQLVAGLLAAKTFDLLDRLSVADMAGADRLVNQLLKLGEDPIRLMALLGYHLRTLIRVSDASATGLSPAAIAKQTQLAPFVVNKSLRQTVHVSRNFLISAFIYLADLDWQIKSGELTGYEAINQATIRLSCLKPV
jgi:DNA polymerase III delta subunit